MKYNTMEEACRAWVNEFNAIPQSLIKKAYSYWEDVTEITPPLEGDRVYIFDKRTGGEITEKTEDDTFIIETDEGAEIEASADDIEVQHDEYLPMWDTIWMFHDSADDYWLEELGGLQAMADCGFRIFEIEEGYIFGIDGCGYDFYEAHWMPLYKARGLKWHREQATA